MPKLTENSYRRIAPELRPDGANSIGTVFNGKVAGLSFDELRLFTNVRTLNGWIFTGSSSGASYALLKYTLPPNLTSINSGTLGAQTARTTMEVPATVTSINVYPIRPTKVAKNIILNSATPPTVQNYSFGDGVVYYVPDEYYDVYCAASVWSGKTSQIKRHSEYTE